MPTLYLQSLLISLPVWDVRLSWNFSSQLQTLAVPLAGPAPWLEKCGLAPWNGFCAIVKTGTIKWPYCVALCGVSALFPCPSAHNVQSPLSELGKAQSNFPSSSSLMVLPLKAWFPHPHRLLFYFHLRWPPCSLRMTPVLSEKPSFSWGPFPGGHFQRAGNVCLSTIWLFPLSGIRHWTGWPGSAEPRGLWSLSSDGLLGPALWVIHDIDNK